MERPHLRTIGVNDFVRWDKEGSLVLSPKFQRRRVWPAKARAFLIDTILRGLPIPKLYMRQHLDLHSKITIHEVVDGQQRLSAVLDFMSDALSLSADNQEYSRKKYSTLPPEAQKAFLSYEFSVDLLIDAADADVLDIFARINSHSVPLNAQEMRNAKYFGSFKSTVYGLGFEHLEFWKKYRILSDMAVARMKEAELTSELVVAMVDGLQDKKKSLDSFYKKWDDRFPDRKRVVDRFEDVIDVIDNRIGDLLGDSNFRRPALFYSLFLALYEIRYGGLGDLARGKKAFGEREGQQLRRAIEVLDQVLESDNNPREYQAFINASQRQTDNLGPRKARHKAIVGEFNKAS